MEAGILHNCKNNFLTSCLTENVEVVFPVESSGELKSSWESVTMHFQFFVLLEFFVELNRMRYTKPTNQI